MSDKVGFKDKFRNKFHIGKVARKPLREEVTGLRARAMKLPQSNSEVKGVVIQLEDAKKIIFGKVKTNQERESSVAMTRNILDKVKPDLERLEKNKPDPVAYEVQGQKASKDDLKRAKELLEKLKPLTKAVDELFAVSKGRPAVLMPPDLGRLDLLGQIETVRVHIGQAIVTPARAIELNKEIDAISSTVDRAGKFINASRGELKGYDKQYVDGMAIMSQVEDALKELAKDKSNGKVPSKEQTRLFELLTNLSSAAHPEMGMINPGGLKTASEAAARELNLAAPDPAAYALTCCEGSKKQNLIGKTLERFDGILKAPMQTLFEHASAVGAVDHAVLSKEVSEARGRISGQIVAEEVNVPAITDPLLEKIGTAITTLKKQAEGLRKRVTDAHVDLEKTLAGIAETKGKKFFAADWIAVDALLNTINGLMPAKDATLDQDVLGKLGSLEPLIAKLKTQADALDPSKSKVGEDKFDLAKAAIEKVLVKGDSPASTLKKYDPKKWAELQEGFTKIDTSVGVARFADAVKAIEDFKTTKFDAAVKSGKELAPAIAKAIKSFSRCNYLYVDAQLMEAEDDLPAPNTQLSTLLALEAEFKKTPPEKAKLEQFTTALEDAFKGIRTTEDLTKAIATSHKTETDKAKTAKDGTKANQQPLRDRFYSLEMQFSEAKAMVKEAKGDPNAVKSLQRLMKQAESEINGVTDDKKTITKPTATMDRIQQRIDLMIAHPEGEVNRSRNELPSLYNEFRQTRADAEGQLHGVMQVIADYMAEQGSGKSVEDLLDRVTEYAVRFTRNGDDFGHSIDTLVDPDRPEGERRKAREHVLAGTAELLRGIGGHPISTLLAESPLAGARGVPRRLLGVLDRLNFTVLTSVEA